MLFRYRRASADLNTMRAGELKTFLSERGVDVSACFDKQDLLQKADKNRWGMQTTAVHDCT